MLVQKNTQKFSAQHLARIYSCTYLDKSFQRKGGWTNPMRGGFIKSVLQNTVLQDVVLVDVEASLDVASDLNTKQYFQDRYNAGYRYVSIDGNNRTKSLYRFIILDKPVSYQFGDDFDTYLGNSVQRGNKKTALSQFSPEVQKELLNAELDVKIVVVDNVDTCSELFIRVNTSKQMTGQEQRNAIIGPLSDWVRNTTVHFQKMLSYAFTEERLREHMDSDELIASYCFLETNKAEFIESTRGMYKGALDTFYERTNQPNALMAQSFRVIEELSRCITSQPAPKPDKTNRSKRVMIDEYVFLSEILGNLQVTILDPFKFQVWFDKVDQYLSKQTTLYKTQTKGTGDWKFICNTQNGDFIKNRLEAYTLQFEKALPGLKAEGTIA